MPSILYLVPTEGARAVYESAADAYMSRPYAERDAGFDLFSAANVVIVTARISQQVKAAYYDNVLNLYRAFYMLPRSSISRTPLRLANSVGLIDAGYRGDIMAAVATAGPHAAYGVSQNERLFQLVAPDLLPWDEVRVVSEIPGGPTLRGTGGFGSTGRVGVSTAALVSTAEEVRALDSQRDISGARHPVDLSGAAVDISGARHHVDLSSAAVDISGAGFGRVGSSETW